MQQLYGWELSAKHDDHAGIMQAFLRSCSAIEKPATVLPKMMGNKQDWLPLCNKANALSNQQQHPGWRDAFFRKYFTPVTLPSMREEGFFTGYYIPTLKGSWTKTTRYKHPIYPTPNSDGLRTKYTRREIDAGALTGKVTPLLYVDDPIELFFLHIQGSGQVILPDGKQVMVGYHNKNGKAYNSIGRHLIDKGYFTKEEMNGDVLKDWLYKHKNKSVQVMHQNPSYVYFRLLEHGFPIGSQGVPVTPMRSLAVDKRHIPMGMPVWLETAVEQNGKIYDFTQLMIAQDTGGAIKGAARGDIFFGAGKEAEMLANLQKFPGYLTAIMPKKLAKRLKLSCSRC